MDTKNTDLEPKMYLSLMERVLHKVCSKTV